MSQPYLPNEDLLIISYSELETALRILCNPDKSDRIHDTLSAVRTMYKTVEPERAVLTLVGGIAWLTEDLSQLELSPSPGDGLDSSVDDGAEASGNGS